MDNKYINLNDPLISNVVLVINGKNIPLELPEFNEKLSENNVKCSSGINKKYNYSSEKKQEYYKNFKEKNLDKIKEKCICEECGGKFTYYNKSTHLKSKKHIWILMKTKPN